MNALIATSGFTSSSITDVYLTGSRFEPKFRYNTARSRSPDRLSSWRYSVGMSGISKLLKFLTTLFWHTFVSPDVDTVTRTRELHKSWLEYIF